MYCEYCGARNSEEAKFCSNCGARTAPGQTNTQQAYSKSYQTPQSYQNYGSTSGAAPLSVKDYLIMMLLMLIPLVNIILLFVWGFGSGENVNKQNYAKANLILMAIGIALYIVGFIIIIVFAGVASMGMSSF